MSFIKNISSTFMTTVFSTLLAIPVGIIIARILGPEGKGIYSLAVLVASSFVLLGSIGLGAAIPYFIGKKKGSLNEIVSTSLIFSLVIGGVLAVCLFLCSEVIIDILFHNCITILVILLLMVTIPFGLLFNRGLEITHGLRLYKKYNALRLIQSVFLLLLMCLLLVFLKTGIIGAVFAYTLTVVLLGLSAIGLVKSHINFTTSLNLQLLKDMMHFGWKPYLGNLTVVLNYKLDFLFVSILLTVSEVGIYSVAVTWSMLMWIIPNAVQTILFPEVAHSSTKEENRSLVVLASRHTFYLTALSNMALYVFAWFAIPFLYTVTFSPALLPLGILIVGSIFFSIVKPLSASLLGEGRSEIGLLVSAPAVLVNVIFDLLLIPIYGINGAAVASTLGYIASFLIVVRESRKTYGFSLSELFLIQKSDIGWYVRLFKRICFW